jgi:hypothetical protein
MNAMILKPLCAVGLQRLLDHLVGAGEQSRRHFEAKFLCSL